MSTRLSGLAAQEHAIDLVAATDAVRRCASILTSMSMISIDQTSSSP
jgi:hypothetical protein